MAEKNFLGNTPLLNELADHAQSLASNLLNSNSNFLQINDNNAFEAYIKFKEDDLKGECTDKDHENWISMNGMDNLATLPVNRSRSAGSVNTTERVNFESLKFTKGIDSSTCNLIAFCAAAKSSDATIQICHSTEGNQQKFIEITLTKANVSSVSIIVSDDEASIPMELISLTFQEITMETFDDKGSSTAKFGWNLKENRAK